MDCYQTGKIRARPIRRKDRALTKEESAELISRGEYGVLATVDAGGQPYAVPLSYVVRDERLYFYSAMAGHKIDNISHNPRVSFAVVGETQPVYDRDFSTYYESVVVFGPLRLVEDEKEKHEALWHLAAKYLPDYLDQAQASIKKSFSRTAVYALEMEVITGKSKKRKA